MTYLALLLTLLMWSSAFIAIRIGMREFQPGSFALLRLSLASLSMFLIYRQTRTQKIMSRKDIFFALFLGLIGMGIYHGFLNLGIRTVTAGIASFIIALSPVFVTLFAALFLGERVSLMGWFGLLISLSGVALISIGEFQNAKIDFGVVYVFISTFSSVIYTLNVKTLLNKANAVHVTFWVVTGGALTALVFLPQLLHDLPLVNTSALLAGLYLGVVPTALASLTYNYALSKLQRSTVVSAYYAMPLMTSLMGWMILSELPTKMSFLGGLLALSGTVLVNATAYK